jgi:hypothetical protein
VSPRPAPVRRKRRGDGCDDTTRPVRRALVLASALHALLAAGCGGDGGGPIGGALPDCANENRRAAVPAAFPEQVPLPPGTVVTDAQEIGPGQFHLRGVVAGDLGGVASFFEDRLPERGFRLGRGDQEAHEKESPFTGHGYRGRWRVVKNPQDCPVVAVFLVLIRQA